MMGSANQYIFKHLPDLSIVIRADSGNGKSVVLMQHGNGASTDTLLGNLPCEPGQCTWLIFNTE